jgi:hypothetical protein
VLIWARGAAVGIPKLCQFPVTALNCQSSLYKEIPGMPRRIWFANQELVVIFSVF